VQFVTPRGKKIQISWEPKMSIFDAPVGRCEAVREMVLLDETQRECAREHGCPPGRQCPLEGRFSLCSGLCETRLEDLPLQARPVGGIWQARN